MKVSVHCQGVKWVSWLYILTNCCHFLLFFYVRSSIDFSIKENEAEMKEISAVVQQKNASIHAKVKVYINFFVIQTLEKCFH